MRLTSVNALKNVSVGEHHSFSGILRLTTDASRVSPAVSASLKQSHQEATSVLYDEAVANDPAGSVRLSVQW